MIGKRKNSVSIPNGQSYIEKDADGSEWVCCCWCGKRQFVLDKDAIISKQHFKCKGSNCKRVYIVNQIGQHLR